MSSIKNRQIIKVTYFVTCRILISPFIPFFSFYWMKFSFQNIISAVLAIINKEPIWLYMVRDSSMLQCYNFYFLINFYSYVIIYIKYMPQGILFAYNIARLWSNCLKLNWKAAFTAIRFSKNHNIIRNYLIYHSIQGMIFDSRVGIYISVLWHW